jgi:hypothetical protein
MHGYKRSPPLRLVCPRAVSVSGKPSPPHPPLFSTASSLPSHLTLPLSPYVGPRVSPEPRAAPQIEGPTPSPPLSFDTVDRVGDFRPSVARLPHCELGLSTVSGECVVGWGSFGVHLAEVCPPVSHREPCHGMHSERVVAERTASCTRCAHTRAASCGQLGR